MDPEENLKFIVSRYKVDIAKPSPIQIDGMSRAKLAKLYNDLGYKIGTEIGTLRGEYAKVICDAIPGVKLYCVDPYISYEGYIKYRTQNDLDNSQEQARERLKHYDVSFVKKFSVKASEQFENESLDFVYIDASHRFRDVVDDMDSWYPKIKKGGMISGHDYIKRRRPTATHVIQAVNGFVGSYNIHPFFITDRPGHFKGKDRDQTRSWFWIKK